MQAYAKFQKDMAEQPPACPEVAIQEPRLHVRIPPLPPLVNVPQQVEQAQGAAAQQPKLPDQQPEGGRTSGALPAGQDGCDASVAVNLGSSPRGAGSGRPPGWGTSNISRPSNLAGVLGERPDS